MSEIRSEKTSSLSGGAAMLITLWAVVLLLAFFSNRGDDLGRLLQLSRSLLDGPIFGQGIVDSLVGAISAVMILVAWFGLGSVLTLKLKLASAENRSHILESVMRVAVGAAAFSLVWFFLGVTGLYSPIAASTMLVFGYLCGVFAFPRLRQKIRSESKKPERADLRDKALIASITLPVFLSFVASLAPPTAKDTLLYHFALPKVFIVQGSNAFIEGNIASYLALGTEMHTVWAMLVGGMISTRAAEAAAGATVWMFFPLLLAAVFGLARELGVERRFALLAVLLVASVPTAYHVAASAYIDLALALFILLAAYALSRWWKSPDRLWLVYVAVFLGAALSVKLTTLFVMAAFALVILFRVREAKLKEPDQIGNIGLYGSASLALACVLAAPWYLRTWIETGSPIFPFYLSIWPGEATGWDIERSSLFQAMNSQYGGYEKSVIDFIAAPWNVSVTAQPEIAVYFDGVLGVAFLLGLPLLVWAVLRFEMPVEANIGFAISVIVFLFWLSSSQQLRYLLPILPLLAIAIVAAVRDLGNEMPKLGRMASSSLVLACIASLLVSTAWFLQRSPHRIVLGGEARDEYLVRSIDYYPYYQWLNSESEPEAKVWLINMRRDTYHLERPYFSDYLFEDWTLRKMVWGSANADELRTRVKEMGIKYILTRHDFLFDYDRSTLVDDSRSRDENEARIKMAKDLLLDPTRSIKADEKFSLVSAF